MQVTQALKNTGFLPDVNGEGSSSSLSPEHQNNSVPEMPQEVTTTRSAVYCHLNLFSSLNYIKFFYFRMAYDRLFYNPVLSFWLYCCLRHLLVLSLKFVLSPGSFFLLVITLFFLVLSSHFYKKIFSYSFCYSS